MKFIINGQKHDIIEADSYEEAFEKVHQYCDITIEEVK